MAILETLRLILVPTPRDVLETRLERDAFSANVALEGKPMRVDFPAEWPGDALVLVPMLLAHYDDSLWSGLTLAVDQATHAAVGAVGCKGSPDTAGAVEIGYGVNPTHCGRGYASEMVQALAAWLLVQPGVRHVTAETSVDNPASIRVLEKSGFQRIGERVDAEDGPLFLWRLGPEA